MTLTLTLPLTPNLTQGFFMARCLSPLLRRAAAQPTHAAALTALHLPWPKFHSPSRGTGARMRMP